MRLWFAVVLVGLATGCDDGASDVTDVGSGDAGSMDAGSVDAGGDCIPLAGGACVAETFANPPVLEPVDGVYRLEIGPTEVSIDGQRHCVRAYNGSFLAPTIDTPARDGDTPRQVRVNLANRHQAHDYRSLDGSNCTCQSGNQSCVPGHIHDRCVPADETCQCVDDDGDACEHMFDFNVTNLHAHGAHVRPDWARGGEDCAAFMEDDIAYWCRSCDDNVCGGVGDDTCFHGDNVLNAVHPGEGAQYRWDIDEDETHHTGLQWYHPHIHGTTAMQVASGAAGAWIVRGALDAVPGIAQARERVMVFSTPSIARNGFTPLAEGEACTDETITFNDFQILSAVTAPQLNVINGQRRPRMITPPNQVERWRLLHAGFLDEVFLGLFRGTDGDCTGFDTDDAIALTQIGRDGLVLPQPFEHPYVFMSPGYRVEAMLGGAGALNHGDTWCLVASRFLQDADTGRFGDFGEQIMAPPTPLEPSDIFARFESDGDVIAILNVSEAAGEPTETALPDYAAVGALAKSMDLGGVPIDERCAAAAATDAVDVDQVAMLQVGALTGDDPDPCDCANYNVNCNNFESTDRARYPFDRDMPLGAIEHWRIAASLDGHPFHIHINPFIVCPNENPYDPMPFPHWRDTYLVNLTRKIDIVTENRAFTGAFVFHCHKLTHEDHGMMEIVRICDPATDETCGDYNWRTCDDDDLQCKKSVAATDCAVRANNPADLVSCILALGGPEGVCGPNACAQDEDCAAGTCVDGLCALGAPCMPPCGPGQACRDGECR